MLLRKKAAEELKKEQERKAAERRRIIEERCGKPKNIEDANEGKLKSFRNQHFYKHCYLLVLVMSYNLYLQFYNYTHLSTHSTTR